MNHSDQLHLHLLNKIITSIKEFLNDMLQIDYICVVMVFPAHGLVWGFQISARSLLLQAALL
jgi:hypothetical protein